MWLGEYLKELTPAKILAAAIVTPIVTWIAVELTTFTGEQMDSLFCGGRAALQEGHKAQGIALDNPGSAELYFSQAAGHYRKAYKCGVPEAGLRLAVAHCLGRMGEPKDPAKARQIILDVEAAFAAKPEVQKRASDARKTCSF